MTIDAREHLESLVGREVFTLTKRRPNTVLRLERETVIVATRRSPHGEPVPIEWVQHGIDVLERD